jgi:membrane protease YdiL (CAAX protease family)
VRLDAQGPIEPASSAVLSLRVATIALVTPVILGLTVMAFWPERSGGPGVLNTSNERFLRTMIGEIVLTVTLGAWLWHRGWRPHRTVTEPFAGTDVLRGLGVWVGAYLGYIVWALLCYLLMPKVVTAALAIQHQGRPTLTVALTLSVANAIFEEFLWLGLGIAALHAAGVRVTVAATTSLVLRLLAHVYQGPLAIIGVLPLGVVFTAYYLWTRRLWPVIVAHAMQDIVALVALIHTGPRGGAV